jgi:hypothetical protein
MGSCEPLFLQMQPYLISHLKLVWYPMLIVALLVLGIGFLQNIMNLLLDVYGFIQQIWFLDQPCSEHGRTLPVQDAMGRATSMGANGWNPKHT